MTKELQELDGRCIYCDYGGDFPNHIRSHPCVTAGEKRKINKSRCDLSKPLGDNVMSAEEFIPVEYKSFRVKIRKDGVLKVRPGVEKIDGDIFLFRSAWKMDEKDTSIYIGEIAWIPEDRNYLDGAPTWIASGDLEEVSLIEYTESIRQRDKHTAEIQSMAIDADETEALLQKERAKVKELENACYGGNADNSTAKLIRFLAGRLVSVYKENINLDYIRAAETRATMLDMALTKFNSADQGE